MIERKRGCPAIVATRNDHALPSRFLLVSLRPARMVHGTSGSALTFARCTRSLIHMKRLRVFQTFVHSVFSRRFAPVQMVCGTRVPHYSRRPRTASTTALTLVRLVCSRIASVSPSRSRVFDPFRWFAGTSGPALFTFEAPLRLRAALPRDGLRDQRSRTSRAFADSARHRTPAGRSGVTR